MKVTHVIKPALSLATGFATRLLCRQRPLYSLNTGEIPSTVRCTSCYDNRELQDFIDDNGDEF